MLTDDEARDLLTRAAATIEVPPGAAAPYARPRRLPLLVGAAALVAIGASATLGLLLPGGGPTGGVDPATSAPAPSASLPSSPAYPPTLPIGVTYLSAPLTTLGAGTQTVALGPRPEGATGVEFRIACLTAGLFVWPGGSPEHGSMECTAAEARTFQRDSAMLGAGGIADLAPGQTSISISGEPGTRWRVVTTYVREEPLPTTSVDPEESQRQLVEQTVPGSECADLLAFVERPDVVDFYDSHFGPSYVGDLVRGRFLACPTAADLDTRFERMRKQAATGDLPTPLGKAEPHATG